MSDSMIERVARAIAQKQLPDAPYNSVDFYWDRFVPHARAAIEAMREPTVDMRKVCSFETAEREYPAMIDVALGE